MPPDFGTLKRVDLRLLWPKEAADFSPWLAQNLEPLGDVLGMELAIQDTEAPVGGYSLDILAKDLGRDRLVVIENQLETTDHTHLGQLLTYAAGYDAGAVVWIAKELREEHRQTLDWLNQHTDASLDFYGVVVEALQIDESKPAFNFKLIASPNEWRKSNIGQSSGVALSEREEAYRTFFQALIDELREKHRFTGARVGQPQNWYSFASGFSGITYGAAFNRDGCAQAEVGIDRGDAPANKAIFDALFQQKDVIETQFGAPLNWDYVADRRACRIKALREGTIAADSQTLEETRNWMVKSLLGLKQAFGPRLPALVQ
jgi:hypothetical protein